VTDIPYDAPRSEDGQWWWDGSNWQPVSGGGEGSSAAASPAQATSLPELRRSTNGWLLTIEGFTEAGAVTGYLWPSGTPPGVSVSADVVVTEPAQVGSFEITGLTMLAVQAMEPSWGSWFAQQMMFPDVHDEGSGQPQPETPAPGAPMDAEKAEFEWRTFFTEGAHTALEFASWFAEEGGEFLTFFEGFAGPVGDALMLYDLFSAVIEAFQEELKDEKRHGFVFGVLWQVMGTPNIAPQMEEKEAWAVTPSMHTFDEHAAAFLEGVAEGRSRVATDLVLHNAIAARIAYHMVKEHSTENSAGQDTLTELAAAAGWTDPFQLSLLSPQVR
jgi:hypothetical protein